MEKFGISTKEELVNGDIRWHNEPGSYDEVLHILLHNGWTELQAHKDIQRLINDRDRWILVNNCCQIC